jgi:hypothetical protein
MMQATSLRTLAVLLLVGALAGPAAAQVIDGQLDGSYGGPIVIQDTNTGFGDSGLGQIGFANGSELDGAYARVSGGFLYLFLAGNMESNYNKLEVFFDTKAGGQGKLRGDNPGVDFNGLNRMGDDGSGNGLIFETGFEADYWIGFTGGDIGGGNYGDFVNYAEILTGGGGVGYYVGGGSAGNGALSGGDAGAPAILATIDNSNVGGVGAGGCPPGPGSGAGVARGVELRIPLSAIGNPTCFRVVAFVNGSSHDYISNQVLGAATNACNMGEPRVTDFRQQPGIQYFEVCGGATPAQTTSWGHVKAMYR